MRTFAFILIAGAYVAAALDAFAAPVVRLADARTVLRAVEQAQSRFYAANGRYSGSLRALAYRPPEDAVVHLTARGAGGWSAVVVAPDEECAVYHGDASTPRSYARIVGRIACRAR